MRVAVEVDEITHKQDFKMVEGENQNKIEETQQKRPQMAEQKEESGQSKKLIY